MEEEELYHELLYYTLSHPDASFIHQNAVDAYTAQHVTEGTKPIAVAFALIGLYLGVERGFTGKKVQQEHMRLARRHRQWPRFTAPAEGGTMTVADVISAEAGAERDDMIRQWCRCVWDSWRGSQARIRRLYESFG